MFKVKRCATIPRDAVPLILGTRGDMIQHIDRQTDTKTHVHIEDAYGDEPVAITTRGKTIEAALNGIAKIQEIVAATREYWVFPDASEQVHFDAPVLFPWVFQDGATSLDFSNALNRLAEIFDRLPCMSIVFRDFEPTSVCWFNQAVVLRDLAYSLFIPVYQDFDSPVIVSKHADTIYYPSFATVYVDMRVSNGIVSLRRHALHGLFPYLPAPIPMIAYPVLPDVNELPSFGYPRSLQPLYLSVSSEERRGCADTWEETHAIHVAKHAESLASRFVVKMLWCHQNRMLMV